MNTLNHTIKSENDTHDDNESFENNSIVSDDTNNSHVSVEEWTSNIVERNNITNVRKNNTKHPTPINKRVCVPKTYLTVLNKTQNSQKRIKQTTHQEHDTWSKAVRCIG